MTTGKSSAALDAKLSDEKAGPNADPLHLPPISSEILALPEAQAAISRTRAKTEGLVASATSTLAAIRNAAVLSAALAIAPAAAAPSPSPEGATAAEYLRLQISDPRALASTGWSPYAKLAALGGTPDIAFTPDVQAMLDALGKVLTKAFSRDLTPAEQEKVVRYYQEGQKSGSSAETLKTGVRNLMVYYSNLRSTEKFLKNYMETGVIGDETVQNFDPIVQGILAGQPGGEKYVDMKKVQDLSASMNQIIDGMKKISEQNRRDAERAGANAEQTKKDIEQIRKETEQIRKEILEALRKIQSM